jgi:hypothetical protein
MQSLYNAATNKQKKYLLRVDVPHGHMTHRLSVTTQVRVIFGEAQKSLVHEFTIFEGN